MQQEPADYELVKRRDEDADLPPGSRPPTRWILAASILFVGAIVGGYFLLRGGDPEPVPVSMDPAGQEGAESPSALGGEPMPGDVPPLEESDAFVRELIRHLSSHPRVAAWLATDGLIRNFSVVVTNVADGRTPAQHLAVMRPSSGFAVTGSDDELRVDPRSYARYDDLADAVASLNTSGTAEIYATLKPRIEEAHRELGGAEGTFDRTLERALIRLLQTPVLEEAPRLRPAGIGYAYADQPLESLSGAQKQLLRMGPRNVRLIQEKLREIALELGIPAARLPPE